MSFHKFIPYIPVCSSALCLIRPFLAKGAESGSVVWNVVPASCPGVDDVGARVKDLAHVFHFELESASVDLSCH